MLFYMIQNHTCVCWCLKSLHMLISKVKSSLHWSLVRLLRFSVSRKYILKWPSETSDRYVNKCSLGQFSHNLHISKTMLHFPLVIVHENAQRASLLFFAFPSLRSSKISIVLLRNNVRKIRHHYITKCRQLCKIQRLSTVRLSLSDRT